MKERKLGARDRDRLALILEGLIEEAGVATVLVELGQVLTSLTEIPAMSLPKGRRMEELRLHMIWQEIALELGRHGRYLRRSDRTGCTPLRSAE